MPHALPQSTTDLPLVDPIRLLPKVHEAIAHKNRQRVPLNTQLEVVTVTANVTIALVGDHFSDALNTERQGKLRAEERLQHTRTIVVAQANTIASLRAQIVEDSASDEIKKYIADQQAKIDQLSSALASEVESQMSRFEDKFQRYGV